jgi:hypothetical protein
MPQQMASVAELQAGMIGARTKAALQPPRRAARSSADAAATSSPTTPARWAIRQSRTANARAADLAPVVREARKAGATSLRAIADVLNAHRRKNLISVHNPG